MFKPPYFITNDCNINRAYRMATSTLNANIMPFKDGILEEEKPAVIAGLGYVTPWTRDASINTWNGGGLICPDITLNTLKSVIKKTDKGYFIDGEYWDKIIWTVGAWWQYLYTGDKEFLALAYEAVTNNLEFFEETEFSRELNLFRGAACYGDGIAAYPDVYAQHGKSGIIAFATCNKDLCEDVGVGLPMYALSTNCLYYYAYVLADKMAAELDLPQKFELKAEKMKESVNSVFWNSETENYRYIHDKFGGCDSMEGLGLSFAILFGIADGIKAEKVLNNTVTSAHGITCVYPSFSRYDTEDKMGFGRHSGTVWPFIQGFWADAAARQGDVAKFRDEFIKQTLNAVRYYQFAEIYHPITGEIYGGRQEDRCEGIKEWISEPYQTWSATAYLRNVYFDIVGMKFRTDGIAFKPILIGEIKTAELKNVSYRNATLNIKLSGNGTEIKSFKINGAAAEPFIPADSQGVINVEIEMG